MKMLKLFGILIITSFAVTVMARPQPSRMNWQDIQNAAQAGVINGYETQKAIIDPDCDRPPEKIDVVLPNGPSGDNRIPVLQPEIERDYKFIGNLNVTGWGKSTAFLVDKNIVAVTCHQVQWKAGQMVALKDMSFFSSACIQSYEISRIYPEIRSDDCRKSSDDHVFLILKTPVCDKAEPARIPDERKMIQIISTSEGSEVFHLGYYRPETVRQNNALLNKTSSRNGQNEIVALYKSAGKVVDLTEHKSHDALKTPKSNPDVFRIWSSTNSADGGSGGPLYKDGYVLGINRGGDKAVGQNGNLLFFPGSKLLKELNAVKSLYSQSNL